MIRYIDIARAVLLRSNQLGDAVTAAGLDVVYTEPDLADAAGGLELPLSALKQQILASEVRIAGFCGTIKNPVIRGPLVGMSSILASGADIPQTDTDGKKWVGNFGAVVEVITGGPGPSYLGPPLTEKPKQEVMRLKRLIATTFMSIPVYHYCIEDTILLHTRPTVVIKGCSWDHDTQATAYDLVPSEPADFTFIAANVNTTTNAITHTAHGYYTGLRVRVAAVTPPGDILPVPLAADTIYYVIVVDADHIKLGTTLANALATTAIDITTPGTGTFQMSVVASAGPGMSPLPQELEVMFAADVLANLSQEEWFVDGAGRYGGIVQKCEADLRQGVIPQATLPDATANQDPVKN